MVGRYRINAKGDFNYRMQKALDIKQTTLYHYTQTMNSNVGMQTDFTTHSTNTVKFYNVPNGINLKDFINVDVVGLPNSFIRIVSTNGSQSATVSSEVLAVDDDNKIITIKDYLFLTYPNVATANGITGTHTINIQGLTGAYDLYNNAGYSNTAYPLIDIVYIGDKVKCNGSVYTVQSINYAANTITVNETIGQSFDKQYLSVNRNFNALPTEVKLVGPIGLKYIPELQTENNVSITTEDGKIIILE